MLPTIPMPSLCAGIRGTLIVASMLFCFPIFAAENLPPSDIQTIFATGKPFSATTPSGKKVQITFHPNGTATAIPKGKKKGIKGTWRLSDIGYCSIWGKGSEHCYVVQKIGDRYDVINRDNVLAAQWTK